MSEHYRVGKDERKTTKALNCSFSSYLPNVFDIVSLLGCAYG